MENMTVTERVARIQKEISGVASQYGIDSRELGFLESIARRDSLTEKQEDWLKRIEMKVFGEEDDD
jgi:hypothetical protein